MKEESPSAWTSPHGTPLPPIGERTLIMGILNVTPDSFSDGGAWLELTAAVEQAHRMVAEGADVIDVGGESTRPGAKEVSADEETARTIPVIRRLKRELPGVPVSIDTYKADVAAAAVEAGADLINDVWGLKHGLEETILRQRANEAGGKLKKKLPISPMAEVAAKMGSPVFLMHNRRSRHYNDFWLEMLADLQVSLDLARAAGIRDSQVWLDPGFGFGKEPSHNLEVVKNLDRLTALGFPVLLGTSRKSTLGLVLEGPADKRVEATAATVVWGIAKGCRMVRVHDIAATRPFVEMADAIRKGIRFAPKKNSS